MQADPVDFIRQQRAYGHPTLPRGPQDLLQLDREGTGQLYKVAQEEEACYGDTVGFFPLGYDPASVMKAQMTG